MRTLTVNKNDAGQRLDKFLTKAVAALLPKSLMYKFIRIKKIKVNRRRAEQSYMLAEGDTVELFIKEEFFSENPDDAFKVIVPRLDIIYEDENFLLLDKRPGVLAHSGDDGEETDTLIEHVKAYLYRKAKYDPSAEQSLFRPRSATVLTAIQRHSQAAKNAKRCAR